ncbi:hypothetical protein K7W42_16720 [Deinococcus sp. HMF7604]|uniref:hypothetical protein n=1 Tax=Deinococcus betulae TaxID=2873312 RepID=UPI001CCF328D|nr:hypothetical protein [Deinococcus betulae]MBZ9752493.1 hypothetical protein [Deinococcus betulae]
MAIYTVWFDYSATGEGWREEIGVVHATAAEEGVTAFFDLIKMLEQVREKFRRGIEITEGVNRPFLARWLTEARMDSLERTLVYAGYWRMSYAVNGG